MRISDTKKMKISEELKKTISSDWQSQFPDLYPFSKNKLYKIIGPIVTGIEIINIPFLVGYKPHFVIYPLWKSSPKLCLDHPIVYKCIENENGSQFGIPYAHHGVFFPIAAELAKKQTINFYGDIPLNALNDFIDILLKDNLVKIHSGKQAYLFELNFYSELYSGSIIQTPAVFSEMQIAAKTWNLEHFKYLFGDLEVWLKNCQDNIQNRMEIMNIIYKNRLDNRFSKLPFSELVS